MTHGTAETPEGVAPGLLLVVGRLLDLPKMGAYSKALPHVYARYRGAYLAMGGPGRGLDWLDGPHRDRSLVLARFASVETVRQFWWSPEYRAAARLREGAGAFNVVALAGRHGDQAPAAGGVYLAVLTITLDTPAAEEWHAGFAAAVAAAGGGIVASAAPDELQLLEGDPAWDRVAIARFPDAAALAALESGPRAAELRALRARAGIACVARAAAFPAST